MVTHCAPEHRSNVRLLDHKIHGAAGETARPTPEIVRKTLRTKEIIYFRNL
jgi:hypothetical protein